MKRSTLLRSALCAALTASAAFAAHAQQPVKLLVGFAAGGPVDVIARAFAEQLRTQTGTASIVENRPGAAGKLAVDALLAAPADGATIMIAPASLMALGPLVSAANKYDPVRDFTAVGSIAEYGFAVAAGPLSGVKDISSYQAWARATPARSAFGSPGQGTPQQFLGAQLQKALGVELVHVPYKGGALSINDVIGGQIPLLIATEQLLVPHEGQGKVNTLFVTSKKRNPLMPKVPTAKEVGLPQMESVDWYGAFVKAGTSQAATNELKAKVQKITASPAYAAAMQKLGYEVAAQQPADLKALMATEQATWAERVKLSGFKAAE